VITYGRHCNMSSRTRVVETNYNLKKRKWTNPTTRRATKHATTTLVWGVFTDDIIEQGDKSLLQKYDKQKAELPNENTTDKVNSGRACSPAQTRKTIQFRSSL